MAVGKRKWKTSKGETREAPVVHYYDQDGIYRQETFKTRKAAKARDAQIKVNLDKGVHQPDSTSKTISDAGEVWLQYCQDEGVDPATLRAYRIHLDYHITPATAPNKVPNAWNGEFGAFKLSRLNGPVCEAFRRRALTSPLSDKAGKIIPGRIVSRRTAQHIWNSFKQMLNVAVKHGLITYNPAHRMRLDTKEREKIRIRIGEQIPDRPDVRAILGASTGMWEVLFSLDAFSGLRESEICALGWPTVDLDNGEIEVVRRADLPGKIGPCKTYAAYRTIQIPDHIIDLLHRWKLICPPSPEDLVFPDDDGNVIHGTKVLRQLYAIQVRIGMVRPDRKLKPNGNPRYPNGRAKYDVQSLRHFYASMMIAAGTDLKRLQELLGHASSKTTMDTYGHLFPAGQAEKDRANKALAAVFESDNKSAGTPPSSRMSEVASARLSGASPAAAAESPVPGSVATMPRGRPTSVTRSPRAFGQKAAPVLPYQ
jgi:integrase